MNAIAKIENAPTSKTVSAAVSAPLWDLLTDSNLPSSEAVEKILRSPALFDEVRRAIPAIDAALAPCGDAYVGARLSEWSIVYDPGARAESPSFWAPYKRALSDLPAEAVLGAMRAWERNPKAEFLPKPGPMRDLALQAIAILYCAAARARMTAKAWPKRLHEFKAYAVWNRAWGPRPGEAGCVVPTDLLAAAGLGARAA